MTPEPPEVGALRHALSSVAEIAGDGSACPRADRLWDSACGTLVQAEDEPLILHLGECTGCAAVWRFGRMLRGVV